MSHKRAIETSNRAIQDLRDSTDTMGRMVFYFIINHQAFDQKSKNSA